MAVTTVALSGDLRRKWAGTFETIKLLNDEIVEEKDNQASFWDNDAPKSVTARDKKMTSYEELQSVASDLEESEDTIWSEVESEWNEHRKWLEDQIKAWEDRSSKFESVPGEIDALLAAVGEIKPPLFASSPHNEWFDRLKGTPDQLKKAMETLISEAKGAFSDQHVINTPKAAMTSYLATMSTFRQLCDPSFKVEELFDTVDLDSEAVDQLNRATLKSLDEDDKTSCRVHDTLMLLGDDWPEALGEGAEGWWQVGEVEMVAKGSGLSAGEVKVTGIQQQDAAKAAIGRISDKKVKFG